MKKYLLVFLIVVPLITAALWGAKVYYLINVWNYNGPDTVFEVRPGETFPSINYRLSKDGLISSTKLFHRYTQYKGALTKFRKGSFLIKNNSSMIDVFQVLIYGTSIAKRVTIPEGKNLYEIGKLLDGKGITSYAEFVNTAKDPQLTRELGIPADRVEGYLYPDTYRFSPKTSAKEVIKIMVSQFRQQIKKLGLGRDKKKLHSIVILASIVEKETGAGHERPMIAGVFHNRLKKRMRLQSDPTTIYGIYEDFNGNLRKKHLLQKTEYNTYKISGLPKGPISNPGLKSLMAVVNPAKHKYLYFVSQNDGTHVFSKTYREHRQAVNRYQKNTSARKGKSWRDLNQKSTN